MINKTEKQFNLHPSESINCKIHCLNCGKVCNGEFCSNLCRKSVENEFKEIKEEMNRKKLKSGVKMKNNNLNVLYNHFNLNCWVFVSKINLGQFGQFGQFDLNDFDLFGQGQYPYIIGIDLNDQVIR